ncbi:MAG: hypothetical protein DI549_12455 [Ancylobacter novellus]|uniref:Uncharacterized protein n=1 Tax=Ancylobacter novellus TaxID=921 RepID=A0A2W5R0Q3_ANCNO|nr:MAG: hypothetical protein DI549_12455 [Ancylobacter novellus]
MQLVPDWRRVLRHAWSIRLMLLAGLLSGLEVALPLFGDLIPIAPRVLAALTVFIVAAAFVARLTAQSKMENRE